MKKIIFYIPSLSPSGGIERVVTTIANQLCEKYNITILTKDDKKSFYDLDGRINIDTLNYNYELNMASKFQRIISQCKSLVNSVRMINKYLRDCDFDYIYITHPISHLELLFSGVDKNKIVISEHGASNNYNSVYRMIKKLTYKKCKFYCVPTRYDFEYYYKFGFPVQYTPHYRPNLDYQQADLNSKVILNIGRFTDDKKQLRLLKIWRDIDDYIRSEWKLKIVGQGELQNDLENFIKDNKLSESVSLSKPRRDIESYYKNAAIFALSSRSEGFGMVLLEAAGFGLPLISFNCPAGPRDIINHTNGFLVDVNDDNTYKDKLIKMMVNHEELILLSDGSNKLSHDWSNEKINNIWINIFK